MNMMLISLAGLGLVGVAVGTGWLLRPVLAHRWKEHLRRQRAAEPLEPGWDGEPAPTTPTVPTLTKICAWCATTETAADWPTRKSVTHGICPTCERKYFGSLKEWAGGDHLAGK